MLARLNVSERPVAPAAATFSGGERKGSISPRLCRAPFILLLDEPTASLDAANRACVVDLIAEKKAGASRY